jgi:coniferyl-aldehyde dehydrogenase
MLVNASDDATVALAELARLHALQRAAFAREPYPSAAVRRDRLARLLALVRDHEREFVAAIDADFGGRSSHETRLGDALIV